LLTGKKLKLDKDAIKKINWVKEKAIFHKTEIQLKGEDPTVFIV
jgi:hypothetical protein